MAAKDAPKSSKPWSPDQPLSLDKAIRNDATNPAVTDRLKKMEDTHLARPTRGQHPVAPSHKSFNRQKKG